MATSAAVVGLMSGAAARDDAGVRQFFLEEAGRGTGLRGSVSTSSPIASISDRPESHRVLTVAVSTRNPVRRAVARKPIPKTQLAVSKPHGVPPMLFASDPRQPAIVSIYDDRTLRRGDAVMTLTGLRVFAGSRTFPYRPEDFTTLSASRNIKGQLRRALIELDQSPLRG